MKDDEVCEGASGIHANAHEESTIIPRLRCDRRLRAQSRDSGSCAHGTRERWTGLPGPAARLAPSHHHSVVRPERDSGKKEAPAGHTITLKAAGGLAYDTSL